MKDNSWLIPFIIVSISFITGGIFSLFFPHRLRELALRYRSTREAKVPIYGKIMTNYINSKAYIITTRVMGALFLLAGCAAMLLGITYFVRR